MCRTHERRNTKPALADCMETINEIAQKMEQFIIVIDAADEIADEEWNIFITQISDLVKDGKIKILVTRRTTH